MSERTSFLRWLLSRSRFLVIFAVLGALAAAVVLFIYGSAETIAVVGDLIAKPEVSSKGAKALTLTFIEIFDLFLLGTVLLIMGVSLYTLFVDTRMRLPGWLQANSFDDLKINLVAVVIVVMGVTFLGHVVAWDGERNLLQFGIAVSLMTAVLTMFLWVAKGARAKRESKSSTPTTEEP